MTEEGMMMTEQGDHDRAGGPRQSRGMMMTTEQGDDDRAWG